VPTARLYLAADPIALFSPRDPMALLVPVALNWLVSDRRTERALASSDP
jgi:hypothetical protein